MKKLINLVLLLVSVLASVYLAEKIAGVVVFNRQKAIIEKERYISLREHAPNLAMGLYPQDKLEPLPFVRTDTLNTVIRTDSNEFIVTEKNHDLPDVKIFFLGGSTTECMYNSELKRMPELVARKLEKQLALKVNAYNAGAGGNNTLHSLNVLINKVLPQQPRMAVLMHNINDVVTLLYLGSYWTEDNVRANINHYGYYVNSLSDRDEQGISFLPNISELLGLRGKRFPDQFKGLRSKITENPPDSLAMVNLFKRNLQMYIDICKVNEIEPVLMTQANNFDVLGYDWFVKNNKMNFEELGSEKQKFFDHFTSMLIAFNKAIIEVATQNQCQIIDLNARINDIALFQDEVHYNDRGCDTAAAIIAAAVLPGLQARPGR